MGLHGKLVAAVEFKPGGDVFHELFTVKPHHVPNMSSLVHGFELHEGEFGQVGSVISWTYTHDGKERFCKQLIQLIDEEKKVIEFKVIEGDLLEKYKDFLVTFHMETKGSVDLVTWTFDYETLNDDVEHPVSLLEYFIDVTKHIEDHHVENK